VKFPGATRPPHRRCDRDPTRVFAGKTNRQFLHLGRNSGSARIPTGLRTIELAGDEALVPGEDGVWPGRAGHLRQSFTPKWLSDLGRRVSLRIRQAQPGGQVRPQNSVLRGQLTRSGGAVPGSPVPVTWPEDEPTDCLHANCPSSQVSDSQGIRVS